MNEFTYKILRKELHTNYQDYYYSKIFEDAVYFLNNTEIFINKINDNIFKSENTYFYIIHFECDFNIIDNEMIEFVDKAIDKIIGSFIVILKILQYEEYDIYYECFNIQKGFETYDNLEKMLVSEFLVKNDGICSFNDHND